MANQDEAHNSLIKCTEHGLPGIYFLFEDICIEPIET
jgi:hypothetical protein